MIKERFSSWFKENTPKEGLSENTTFTKQFVNDAWNNGYISGYNEANEWHKVSDKLPEMDVFVYIWNIGDNYPFVARRCIPSGWEDWCWDCTIGIGKYVSQLGGKDFLWKEIIPPKEKLKNG